MTTARSASDRGFVCCRASCVARTATSTATRTRSPPSRWSPRATSWCSMVRGELLLVACAAEWAINTACVGCLVGRTRFAGPASHRQQLLGLRDHLAASLLSSVRRVPLPKVARDQRLLQHGGRRARGGLDSDRELRARLRARIRRAQSRQLAQASSVVLELQPARRVAACRDSSRRRQALARGRRAHQGHLAFDAVQSQVCACVICMLSRSMCSCG